MKRLSLSALSILAALATSTAFAAAPEAKPGTMPHGQMQSKMFADTDTNADGTISKEEWTAKGDKMFAEIDGNKDGNISQDEMKAHHEAKRAEWQKRKDEMHDKMKAKTDTKTDAVPAEKK